MRPLNADSLKGIWPQHRRRRHFSPGRQSSPSVIAHPVFPVCRNPLLLDKELAFLDRTGQSTPLTRPTPVRGYRPGQPSSSLP